MIWAWLGAALIGLSLGLLGSGGSILTVPILVFLLGHDERSAMAESLAIVGAIALVGAAQQALRRQIDWRSVVYFGVPGMAGAYLGASIAGHLSGAVLLAIFAALMLIASFMMFRHTAPSASAKPGQSSDAGGTARSTWKIVADGILVGAITGMVGAGGGFLIVPALVVLGGLRMNVAIGTSLCIIALKSAAGFLKYLSVVSEHARAQEHAGVDWGVIGKFAVIGIVGSLTGQWLADRIPQNTLKRIFAVFLIVMAGYILVRQAPRVLPGVFGPASAIAPADPSYAEHSLKP